MRYRVLLATGTIACLAAAVPAFAGTSALPGPNPCPTEPLVQVHDGAAYVSVGCTSEKVPLPSLSTPR